MSLMPEPAVANRREWIAGALLLGTLGPWSTPAGAATAWPEIELRTTAGRPVIPGGDGVKATYVDFWASWCAPCRLSFPWMNEMHDRLGPAGLRIVAINLDRKEADARRFLAQWPPRFEIAFDPAAESARRLNIQAMPTSMLVGADGRILFTHKGFRPEERASLEERLRAALA